MTRPGIGEGLKVHDSPIEISVSGAWEAVVEAQFLGDFAEGFVDDLAQLGVLFGRGDLALGADHAVEGDEGQAEGAEEGGLGGEVEVGGVGFAHAADADAHEVDLVGEADVGGVPEGAAVTDLEGAGVKAVLEGVLVAFRCAAFARRRRLTR